MTTTPQQAPLSRIGKFEVVRVIGSGGGGVVYEAVHPELKARKITLQTEEHTGKDGQPEHIKNFLECLSTRQRPICDIEIGHRSTNTCHLGNIAYRLGRKLIWDGENETFKGDREANALLYREPRRGFELPNLT